MKLKGKPITGPILDKIGQEIKPGCIIAYGHALGRCAGLRLGKVLQVMGATEGPYRDDMPNGGDRQEFRISVHGLDDDWFDTNQPNRVDWSGEKQSAKLLAKKITIMFPSRIIVIDSKKLPEAFRELFDTIKVEG